MWNGIENSREEYRKGVCWQEGESAWSLQSNGQVDSSFCYFRWPSCSQVAWYMDGGRYYWAENGCFHSAHFEWYWSWQCYSPLLFYHGQLKVLKPYILCSLYSMYLGVFSDHITMFTWRIWPSLLDTESCFVLHIILLMDQLNIYLTRSKICWVSTILCD